MNYIDILTKNILLIFCGFIFFSCKGQDKTKELKFTQVGWTLPIPENSDFLSPTQFDSLQTATKKKTNLDFELSESEVLFLIRKDAYNYFGSSITAFDTTNFKTWESAYSFEKKTVVDIIKSNEPLILLLDSASSTENIDGLIFQKFYMKTSYPRQNLILENYWYYRQQDNLEFSINVTFNNKDIGNNYLTLLRASKFDK